MLKIEIHIKGQINEKWSDWFGGFTLTPQTGETVLEGEVTHQAALHGILAKINELGLVILSVEKITACQKRE